jgi:metallo-beta-lactamase class B
MPIAPGARFGSYQVIEPIGSGGMGEVYRARDAELGRDVAIKVLPVSFSDLMRSLVGPIIRLSLAVVIATTPITTALHAQQRGPADHPAVTVKGQTYTPASILARNMRTSADQETPFPPHKVVGNVYYVGTRTLSSFLVVTPQGHILIDSTYERNVPAIKKSVEQLGFKFSDIKILLGNHAHSDHQEGDAEVKKLTGATVMAMAEDVPALKAMMPGGKEHPVDRVLRDGDEVSLGGTTLVAHLTAGHTRGATTYTAKVRDGPKTYDVVFFSSLRAPGEVTDAIAAEFDRTFSLVRSLPCDVPLGDHPAEYNMQAKYASLATGGANPFVDNSHCFDEADIQEAMYHAVVEEQKALSSTRSGK